MKSKIIAILILLIALGGLAFFWIQQNKQNSLIRVDTPIPNQEIESPLKIRGEARGFWFFEASFPIELVDANGKQISLAVAQAQNEWMTEDFVPFETTMTFNAPETKTGTLILKKDNPSGLPEHDAEFKVPVFFKNFGSTEKMKVLTFFSNSQLDPEISCTKVFAVEREVQKTQAVARAALEELLKGVNDFERYAGFNTSINPEVKIQKLTIEDGTAYADFDEQLQFQVGGSCRVTAIRAQITQTLKQFPTVKNVIISINGRTEDILQP